MIISRGKDDTKLMALLPSIKQYTDEWQVIHVNILKDSSLTSEQIIDILQQNYRNFDGLAYPLSDTRIVMLIRLGIVHNYTDIKADIEKKLPQHSCRITLKRVSEIGIKQIQIDLVGREHSIALTDNLFHQRRDRKENVILVVDDDDFVRLTMVKLLAGCGKIQEIGQGKKVLSKYLEINPDIIFLDIHMPDKTGLEIVPEILNVDPDAFIVMLSSDSQRQNVISALDCGAVGFLSKPPGTVKIQEYISQCITIR